MTKMFSYRLPDGNFFATMLILMFDPKVNVNTKSNIYTYYLCTVYHNLFNHFKVSAKCRLLVI